MNENMRKFIAGLITGLFVFGALTFYALETRAVNPSITYASPSNGATFVSVWRGHGVNITVNVSDADGDLQQVVLKWNNSGTWATFYDSGALGGVSYHNVTVLNTNFTGSWVTYQWQICAKDGTGWTNTTYEFTTEYVWGDAICIKYNDIKNYYYPCILKNNTNDYFLAWSNYEDYDIETIHTQTLLFINKSVIDADEDANYNGVRTYYVYLYKYGSNVYIAYHDETTYIGCHTEKWNSSSASWEDKELKWSLANSYVRGNGLSVKYYNGRWITVFVHRTDDNYPYLYYRIGSSPFDNSYTYSGIEFKTGTIVYDFYPAMEIFDGYLVLVYRDAGNDLHWQTYDGINWVDKGDIELDIGDYGLTLVKDPVNNQLVLIYINSSGNIYYRILNDIDSGWSSPYLLFSPAGGKTAKHPYAQFIDRRIVVVFSYDLRGTYDIYMISAPEYLSSASGGVLKQYNRIQFPDAVPNQKNVNSSVFYFENINSRSINWINWSFSDIGSIQCENNIRLWGSTDNSSWTLIGTTDANGYINMTTTTWAGGLPWQAGEKRYFKLEILDIGNVPEDLHSVDEGIILKVGLA